MNLVPLTVGWAVLAVIVAALIIARKFVSAQEDDVIHLTDASAPVVAHQSNIAHKLDVIDRWGKILAILLAVYGLAIVLLMAYRVWTANSTYSPGL